MAKVCVDGQSTDFMHDDSNWRNVYGTECSSYTPEYLAARDRVGEHMFEGTPSGAKLCYFRDGPDDGLPLYCFHGGGEGKFMFLQKEPIPGVLQIAIDRHGYGKSTYVADLSFDDIIADIIALADSLGHKKIVVNGFSIGSSWAMQLAAAPQSKERVIGCMVWGAMVDTFQPDFPKAAISKVGRPPALMNPKTGCCGCILRWVFANGAKQNLLFRQGKNDLKYGMERECNYENCKAEYAKFKGDHFWINTKIDSLTLGFNSSSCPGGKALLDDAVRTLCSKWPYHPQGITCPMTITQGAGDYDMMTKAPDSPNVNKSWVPHAELELVPGCGHVCIYGPVDRVRSKIEKFCAPLRELL